MRNVHPRKEFHLKRQVEDEEEEMFAFAISVSAGVRIFFFFFFKKRHSLRIYLEGREEKRSVSVAYTSSRAHVQYRDV